MDAWLNVYRGLIFLGRFVVTATQMGTQNLTGVHGQCIGLVVQPLDFSATLGAFAVNQDRLSIGLPGVFAGHALDAKDCSTA